MAKSFSFQCRHAGVVCRAKVKGDSEDEVLQAAVEHARKAHGVDLTQSRSLVRLVQSEVRDEDGARVGER